MGSIGYKLDLKIKQNSHTSVPVQKVCSYAHYCSFVQLGIMCTVLCSHDGFDTPGGQVHIAFVNGSRE